MTQREAELQDQGKQKDATIELLKKELESLQQKDYEKKNEVNELSDRNKELSDTLTETNQALETLQHELYELRAKLKNAPNNNDIDAVEEEVKREKLFPDVQPRTHSQPSTRGGVDFGDDGDEPDEASHSYSAEGYQRNVRKKKSKHHRDSHASNPPSSGNSYPSDSDTDQNPSKRNQGDIGVKGLREKSKKKKEERRKKSHRIWSYQRFTRNALLDLRVLGPLKKVIKAKKMRKKKRNHMV